MSRATTKATRTKLSSEAAAAQIAYLFHRDALAAGRPTPGADFRAYPGRLPGESQLEQLGCNARAIGEAFVQIAEEQAMREQCLRAHGVRVVVG